MTWIFVNSGIRTPTSDFDTAPSTTRATTRSSWPPLCPNKRGFKLSLYNSRPNIVHVITAATFTYIYKHSQTDKRLDWTLFFWYRSRRLHVGGRSRSARRCVEVRGRGFESRKGNPSHDIIYFLYHVFHVYIYKEKLDVHFVFSLGTVHWTCKYMTTRLPN